MEDYGLADRSHEVTLAAARIARQVVDDYEKTTDRPRFVIGSIGPTNKTASLSPDVSDPAFRSVTFDDLFSAYRIQAEALIEGGVDLLAVETAFDTLNMKAGLAAVAEVLATGPPAGPGVRIRHDH